MQIISERRTYADGHRLTKFEMITDVNPTNEEIREAQIRLGYHPNGYGGPFDIKRERVTDGANSRWKTTWGCFGTCD